MYWVLSDQADRHGPLYVATRLHRATLQNATLWLMNAGTRSGKASRSLWRQGGCLSFFGEHPQQPRQSLDPAPLRMYSTDQADDLLQSTSVQMKTGGTGDTGAINAQVELPREAVRAIRRCTRIRFQCLRLFNPCHGAVCIIQDHVVRKQKGPTRRLACTSGVALGATTKTPWCL